MKDRKKKTTYNPYKVSIIIIVGFLVLVLLSSMYSKSRVRYQWLTCTKNGDSEEYKEVLQFKFLAKQDGVLYEFFRDETYYYEKEEDLNKIYDYLVDYRNDMKSIIDTTNVKYDIKKKDKNIFVNTYIKVGTMPEVFNDYVKSMGITKSSTSKEVYEAMTKGDQFTCIETETK
jgi:hypothetical protein